MDARKHAYTNTHLSFVLSIGYAAALGAQDGLRRTATASRPLSTVPAATTTEDMNATCYTTHTSPRITACMHARKTQTHMAHCTKDLRHSIFVAIGTQKTGWAACTAQSISNMAEKTFAHMPPLAASSECYRQPLYASVRTPPKPKHELQQSLRRRTNTRTPVI